MESLPLIPGYSVNDPTIQDFRLRQKLNYFNGFRFVRDSHVGIGGRPMDAASSAFASDHEVLEYDPSLIYGKAREYDGHCRFVPHYELFAQKCLHFKAYFRQTVNFNLPNESFCIRHVNIQYFLEDDTMSVKEPVIENAGYQQGKLVRRGKILKNGKTGNFYHWKDMNVGLDIAIYGTVYHTVDCDSFTREFLNSQGIDVGEKRNPPLDPHAKLNSAKLKEELLPPRNPDDQRRRFLEYDGMILSFEATWNGDSYNIMYYLMDNTIAIRQIYKPNDGKDPKISSNLLLRRTRVPKNLSSIYLGVNFSTANPKPQTEYYSPRDFKIGETISIFGRCFYLLNCDTFTRKYYSDMLGIGQPPAKMSHTVTKKSQGKVSSHYSSFKPPPHIGFGTPEDTLASCLSVIPKPPKKDVIRYILNFPKKLRYSMKMKAVHPEDENREFVLEYNLSDGTMLINEVEKRNSGRKGGCFLSSMRVPKPGSDHDNPCYYTSDDFFIGANINILNHHFIINNADLFVYRYMEEHPEIFSQELRDNLREHFMCQGMLHDVEKMKDSQNCQQKLDKKTDKETYVNDLQGETSRKFEINSSMNSCMEKNIIHAEIEKSQEQEKLNNSLKKEIKWNDEA